MRILAKEHLALRAVARIMATEAIILARDGRVDIGLLEHIAAYIAQYPNKIHHPKEEEFLFRHMRARAPERCTAILDRLLGEHTKEQESIATFLQALAAFRNAEVGAATQLAQVTSTYAKYLERHIDLENTQAFPMAEEVLQEADWDDIDAAFLSNDDPLVGTKAGQQFAELHRRIIALGTLPPGI